MPRYSWIEIAVLFATLLIVGLFVARVFWGQELLSTENQFFEYIGFGGARKYLITVPMGMYWLYSKYRDDAKKHKKVVRTPVIVFSLISLLSVFLYLDLVVGNRSGT